MPQLPIAADKLQRGDVITHFDGAPIANDGTVAFGAGGERIYLTYLISQKYVGESAQLKILRGGRTLPPASVALQSGSLLVPVHSSRRKGGAHDLRMPQVTHVTRVTRVKR